MPSQTEDQKKKKSRLVLHFQVKFQCPQCWKWVLAKLNIGILCTFIFYASSWVRSRWVLQIYIFGVWLLEVHLNTSHCYYYNEHISPVNKVANFEMQAYGQRGNSSELVFLWDGTALCHQRWKLLMAGSPASATPPLHGFMWKQNPYETLVGSRASWAPFRLTGCPDHPRLAHAQPPISPVTWSRAAQHFSKIPTLYFFCF